MRKNLKGLIIGLLAIPLSFSLLAILTQKPQAPVSNAADDRPVRSRKTPSLPIQRLINGRDSSPEEPLQINASQPFHDFIIQAVLKQIPTRPEAPMLLHYLNQLQPENDTQLQDVLDVAMEAHAQMLAEQQPTQDAIAELRRNILEQAAHQGEPMELATAIHLDNLERRAQMKRNMNWYQEKTEAWTSFKLDASPPDEAISLRDLEQQLVATSSDINAYELKLAPQGTLADLLRALNAALESAVDQQTIIDKFDHIFAALDSVDLSTQ